MLCAAFPLDPLRAFHAPGNTLPLEDLYQLAPPSRSFADMASDRDIFWWGGLENGMLPTGFSDRLARIDACEEADCRRPPLSPASDDRSDDNDASGPPSSSTTPHTPSQPNASSFDHASTSSSPTPKAAKDEREELST